jgi:hypothetical protein
MPRPLQPPATFWRQVDRCAHPHPCPDCCWPWRGTTTAQGYGAVMRTLFGHQETYVHRIAWILHHGRRPRRGHHIALRCGLAACCSPLHGQEQCPRATQAVYLRSARVGRRRRALKVSPALADRIRQAWIEQQPVTQRQFAAQWGISQTTVSQILRAERHKPAPAGVL